MRRLYYPHGLLGICDLGKLHIELDCQPETSLLGRQKVHATVDRHIVGFDVLAAGDHAEGAFETGCISDCEELLRVRAAAVATLSVGMRSRTSRAPSLVRP